MPQIEMMVAVIFQSWTSRDKRLIDQSLIEDRSASNQKKKKKPKSDLELKKKNK